MSQDIPGSLDELRRDLHQLESQIEPGALQLVFSRLDDLEQGITADQEQRRWFISHVSHELRVPMTSILGYTDLLRKGIVGPLNEQQLEFLTVIRNNTERMAALIADLSDLSKADAGSLKLTLVEVALEPVLEEVARNLQPLVVEKGQFFEVDLPGDLPEVLADPRRLSQVLARLLNNASRYTPEKGQIILQVRQQPPFVRFSVKDTGIGISPEDQARLFSQFFRSEHACVREQTGWGLSLSVVKVLVECMDGTVGVSSTLGEGSDFWFVLPGSAG